MTTKIKFWNYPKWYELCKLHSALREAQFKSENNFNVVSLKNCFILFKVTINVHTWTFSSELSVCDYVLTQNIVRVFQCISQWLVKDKTCPICRQPVESEVYCEAELWRME